MRDSRKFVVAALLLGAVFVVTPLVIAGDVPNRPNQTPKVTRESGEAMSVDDIGLAFRLAEYGRRTQDPLALLAAARILKVTPSQEMKTRPVTLREEGYKAKEKTASGSPAVNAENLLAEARKFAGEDKVLLSLADGVQSERQRGRMGGPTMGTFRLAAHSYQNFTEVFTGDELARVVLRGDGDTDLDLYVHDENGNLIASDTDGTDLCICEWVPRWTGPFVIRVENLGEVWNQYSIATN